MQSSWFKLFGKNFKIKTAQYVNDKTRYDIDKENNVITIFTKNIAKLETNIQYVYQDLFFKVLVPVIKEIIKEAVVKSGLNTLIKKLHW